MSEADYRREKERAKAQGKRVLPPRQASALGAKVTVKKGINGPRSSAGPDKARRVFRELSWLRFDLPIADSLGLRRSLSRYLASGHAYLAWNERRGKLTSEWPEIMSFSDALADAAKRLGVSYSTLHRLVRPGEKTPSAVTARSYFQLRKRLRGPDAEAVRRDLDGRVLGRGGRRVISAYLAYISREADRIARKMQAHSFPTAEEKRMRRRFEKQAADAGVPATRAQLGVWRAYGPLDSWDGVVLGMGGAVGHALQAVRSNRRGSNVRTEILRDGYRRELRLIAEEVRVLRDALHGAAR